MTFQTPEIQQTEFNSNVATLERIDQLLRLATNAHYEEDLAGYFKHLQSLLLEIQVKMKPELSPAEKKKLKKGEEGLSELDMSKKLFKSLKSKYFLLIKKALDIEGVLNFERLLYDFEFFLRDIANKRGMLLSDKKDSSWDALK